MNWVLRSCKRIINTPAFKLDIYKNKYASLETCQKDLQVKLKLIDYSSWLMTQVDCQPKLILDPRKLTILMTIVTEKIGFDPSFSQNGRHQVKMIKLL